MAKKTISRLSVLAVLIAILSSCSKTSEYTNVIPTDASLVISINSKSLANKAGMDNKDNEAEQIGIATDVTNWADETPETPAVSE